VLQHHTAKEFPLICC